MINKYIVFLALCIVQILASGDYLYKTVKVKGRGKAKMSKVSKGLAYAKKYYKKV